MKKSMFEKILSNAINCEDGTTMRKCTCNKYGSFVCNCSQCGTVCDFHEDRNSTNRYRREKYSSKKDSAIAIEGIEVELNAEVPTALTGGFDETGIEM